jgi:glucokinase
MNSSSIVALDIGGSTINVGRYNHGVIEVNQSFSFSSQQDESEILQFIIACIEQVKDEYTVAIAIGVPCIVDTKQGIVFDTLNIPAWKKYNLKSALSVYYSFDIYINNDVNCFIAGECMAGQATQFSDVVGICLGTGFGAGFFINNQLYTGHNCSAGEVGSIGYLDGTIDDYCSGKFFTEKFKLTGLELASLAEQGDKLALSAFEIFGKHLANAISHLLLVIDPQIIFIGGSVAQSYHLFIDALWQALKNFPYQTVVENLQIKKSELLNAPLLGATHLYLKQSSE